MAEGGGSDMSMVGGHEFVFDFNCSICIRDKETYTEAAHFCPDCSHYYCKKCFFDLGCDHGTLGRASVDKWGKPSRRIHFDECPDHKTNTLQLYCERDDVVCCAICGQTDHKNCGQLKYIPLIASDKKNQEHLKKLQTDLQQLQTTNQQLLQEWKAKLANLQDNHRQLSADIKQVKANYFAELDKLEQASLNEVNKFKTDFENKFKSELRKNGDIKSKLSELRSKLSKTNIDDSLMFARIKQGEKLIRKSRKVLSELSPSKVPHQARFVSDTHLDECINNVQHLGTLRTDLPRSSGDIVRSTQSHGHGLYLSNSSQTSETYRPYTVVKHLTSFNAYVKGDKDMPSIAGMCQLPDGSILLSDSQNKTLKRLDGMGHVIGRCSLADIPYDVCNTDVGEVAVALYFSNTIQFVSVGDTMTPTRSFFASHKCWSLAYHNKRLYVISGKAIAAMHVYSLSGDLLQTISKDQHGTPLFSRTSDITISPTPDRILVYVADKGKGLVTLDLEGNLLNIYKPPELAKGATSVCVDECGNVFVNECGTCRVVQIGREGNTTVARILSGSEEIDAWRLCFDNVSNRLLVSAGHCHDTVTVLQLSNDFYNIPETDR